MAVSLQTTLKRQIHLHGVDTPVNLTIHPHGIEMTVAGSRTKIFGSWAHVAESLHVPDTAPSIYHGRALNFLKHLAAKLGKG
jgi:hypothetical protein